MGVEKVTRRVLAVGGFQVPSTKSAGYQERTQLSTSTGTLNAYGVTFLQPGGSTADKTFTLPNPPLAGLHKYIINGTSGTRLVTVQVTTSTASGHLFGTTFRQIQFSSAAPGAAEASETVHLISRTTSQWAVAAASTGVTFAA